MLVCLLFSCQNQTKSDQSSEVIEEEDKGIAVTEASLKFQWKAELGEGAIWDHKNGRLFWVDILKREVHVLDPESKELSSFPTPSRVGTVVPETDSTAVIALEDGMYRLDLYNKQVKLFTSLETEMDENRFNDGKCDPMGNLWVGSMNLAETEATGKLYKVSPGGKTEIMFSPVTISNGIVWSSDGGTMYYIDTPSASIRAFDFDLETASISNERVAVKVPQTLGYPDGMTIDSEDKLWVGMWNGNAVLRFDPESGEVIGKINVPAHNVTACAFGGPELDKLYITTARVDMSPEELEAFPWPDPSLLLNLE
ncbi:SMP-30/gluconolactonase/LRE family protein [Aureitalea marina]|uniref:SMP-30/gluconolactonase/LRE family protein n=1 Tax=Aureitalea marina TaxID=930804 RepID=UPI000CF29AD2|nr:SMP-30/gluconolactonase/LRE family protein [Aureitalea marina]